ncbi:MAG: hypothetical protein PVS3B2_09910 [Candidatus Dormibacteraceae bacterium]
MAAVQATEVGYPPKWVWWTLLVGAALLVAWAWFVLGFLGEPSAVGRSRAVLGIVAGGSIGTAIFAAVAAVGLVKRAGWAPRLALVAAGFMVLTCMGAVAGIPALIGLMSPRRSS